MPRSDLAPGDCVQVDVSPPQYKFSRSTVDVWSKPIANLNEDKGQTRVRTGTMDVHDLGIVLAVAKNDQMNWCFILFGGSLGWTLAAFLQKVPRA